MTELPELTTLEEKPPVEVEVKPKQEILLDTDKSFDKLDDDDFDKLIDEAEKAFGRKFLGDRELAKFYLDEFVSGVVSVFEQQEKRKDLRRLRLGMVDGELMASGGFFENEATKELSLGVAVDFRVLEHMTFFDSDESYSDFRFEDTSLGPTWFAARQLGVEEGAHVCFIGKKGEWEALNKFNNGAEYHQTDVEQDGLAWRIFDAERTLEDPHLSVAERLDISQRLMQLKRLMRESYKIRMYRDEPYARYKIVGRNKR